MEPIPQSSPKMLALSLDPRILAVLMQRLGVESVTVTCEELESAGRLTIEKTEAGLVIQSHCQGRQQTLA